VHGLAQSTSIAANGSTLAAAAAMPTGSVTFRDGTTLLATVALDANGHASYATNTLAIGAHAISASYSGDAGNAAAVGSNMQQVDPVVAPSAAVPAPALSLGMLMLLAFVCAGVGVRRVRR
jgi:hypothetical protein